MKNQFFDQKIFNNFDTPMQKLMELNVKMMQNLSYMKPLDLLSVKKPEEIFEKQIELFAQNSQMMLDYMRTTFNILENHWFNISRNFDPSQQKMMQEAFTTTEKSTKKAATVSKSPVKKVAATKKSASTAKKATSDATTAKTKKDTAKSSKAHDTKTEKKKAKKSTPTPVHAKESITQSTSNGSENISTVNAIPEKTSAQDLNIQKH
ncbi:hypothetical protein Lsan_2452 [Legionella santicrucis]|uniref:Phasin protein n=1 Tax=Legionella santicrucis TaxID=45074 RepID=A0A0W0YQE6_9GAMM|nr:hypothetical protein [Legionella santicrucis]KTD59101.1 hypothetical protein Lsan_2452 [Legionella santicrucis]